jgi:hypothetical protein
LYPGHGHGPARSSGVPDFEEGRGLLQSMGLVGWTRGSARHYRKNLHPDRKCMVSLWSKMNFSQNMSK